MQHFEQLDYSRYYHVYNHAVGGLDLYRTATNYDYFLALYEKYVEPIAETYAWCLMPNHFHLLVRIKDEANVFPPVPVFTPDRVLSPQNPVRGKNNKTSLQFSKLFNSYAQSYHKYHRTRGALFERPFKRKLVDTDEYLLRLVRYIHHNPVHHGFCIHPADYQWSSYNTCLSNKPTKLHRNKVMDWFDGIPGFIAAHSEQINMDEMDTWLDLRLHP